MNTQLTLAFSSPTHGTFEVLPNADEKGSPFARTILDGYNVWRAAQGKAPIQLHTLVRYFAGGKGYEKGLPRNLMAYLRTLL